MMMSKRATMPPMMAWRTAPMPLTMAMRQAPIVWKMALIWGGRRLAVERFGAGREMGMLTHDTTAPMLTGG